MCLVVAGGIIPEEDRAGLEAAGISAIFGPGSTIAEIATYLRAHVRTQLISSGAGLRTTRELAQAISSVERGGPAADALIQTALDTTRQRA